MNLRLHLLSSSLISLLVAAVASAAQDDADQPFDCHIAYNDLRYDLTSLGGEHTLRRTRDSPPTTMIDVLTFNLCEDLKPQDGVDDADQVKCLLSFLGMLLSIRTDHLLVSTAHTSMLDNDEPEAGRARPHNSRHTPRQFIRLIHTNIMYAVPLPLASPFSPYLLTFPLPKICNI